MNWMWVVMGIVLVGGAIFLLWKFPNLFKAEGGINWERLLKDTFQYALAFAIVWLFWSAIAATADKIIPPDNKNLYENLIQTVRDAFMILVGYFFGSSKGSSDKNDTIATAVKDA